MDSSSKCQPEPHGCQVTDMWATGTPTKAPPPLLYSLEYDKDFSAWPESVLTPNWVSEGSCRRQVNYTTVVTQYFSFPEHFPCWYYANSESVFKSNTLISKVKTYLRHVSTTRSCPQLSAVEAHCFCLPLFQCSICWSPVIKTLHMGNGLKFHQVRFRWGFRTHVQSNGEAIMFGSVQKPCEYTTWGCLVVRMVLDWWLNLLI